MKRTVAILLSFLTIAGTAQALVVSKEVGPLLQDAQRMIAAKNYKAALTKLNEADAVKSTPDDANVINQMKQFIAVKPSDPTQPRCTSARIGDTGCDGRAIGVKP